MSAELETGAAADAPLFSKGRLSSARVLDGLYVACRSGELGEKPLAVTVLDHR